MSKILFIDDEREFETVISGKYIQRFGLPQFNDKQKLILSDNPIIDIARNYDQAIQLLSYNQYDMIFFDHDLGENQSGKDIANWITKNIQTPFEFYVHSANIVGRTNIHSLLFQYNNFLNNASSKEQS